MGTAECRDDRRDAALFGAVATVAGLDPAAPTGK